MTNDNKSFIAKIAESILKSTKADYMGSLELSKELLDTRLKQEDKPVKSFFKSSKIDGVEVFTFGNKEKSKNTIVYIHGGAFINKLSASAILSFDGKTIRCLCYCSCLSSCS